MIIAAVVLSSVPSVSVTTGSCEADKFFDQMSLPLTTCCGQGFIDSGEPQGSVETIAGVSCYVSAAADGQTKECVVIATDIFGYTLPNVRLIADSFASAGYHAVVPDMFKGSEAPSDVMESRDKLTTGTLLEKMGAFAYIAWLLPGFLWRNSFVKNKVDIDVVLKELRVQGATKIALLGYCWGGKVAVLCGREDLADVVVAAHPGRLQFPEDINLLQKPTLFILSEKDRELTPERQTEIIELLRSKGPQYDGETYPGVDHGFAVRGNENDPHVKEQRVKAYERSLSFVKERFAQMDGSGATDQLGFK
ncbi:hypothetical protein HDU91_005750 [Kappamyces sp. JEL0680]|nr:hypothetical protein HDU91_005750 [Kappamyces sp. JEL0680]